MSDIQPQLTVAIVFWLSVKFSRHARNKYYPISVRLEKALTVAKRCRILSVYYFLLLKQLGNLLHGDFNLLSILTTGKLYFMEERRAEVRFN